MKDAYSFDIDDEDWTPPTRLSATPMSASSNAWACVTSSCLR